MNVTPVFFRRALLVVCAAVVAIGLILMLWLEIRVLLLGFAGLLAAVMFYRLSDWLARWTRMPYLVCLVVIILLLVAIIAGIFWLTASRISMEASQLKVKLPQAWDRLQTYLNERSWGRWMLEHLHIQMQAARTQGWLMSGAGILSSIGVVAAEVFIVIFVGLFGAITPGLYIRGIMHLVPPGHRPKARELMQAIAHIIWWWLVGQFWSMLFIGVVTGLAVWLLGVRMALTLGLIAAVLNFIPNFGPIIAVVPAAMLALLVSPMTALWIVLAYTAIQIFQDHVVTPVVQQKAVRLPAVVLMLAQVFMYLWAGLLGMALAPALAAIVMRVVQIVYVRDKLGDVMPPTDNFWPPESFASESSLPAEPG